MTPIILPITLTIAGAAAHPARLAEPARLPRCGGR